MIDPALLCVGCMLVLQQSIKEDVFPDAEGWDTMDPDEAAKWAVGSEFPPEAVEQSQTEGGPAVGMHTGTVALSLLMFVWSINKKTFD